jgi:hypothetical protein
MLLEAVTREGDHVHLWFACCPPVDLGGLSPHICNVAPLPPDLSVTALSIDSMSTPATLDGGAGSDEHRQNRLTALLRQAVGLDPVRPLTPPEIGCWVMLDEAIEIKSTQRICLQQQGDTLILRTWPGELKPQAEALYRTSRAQRLVQFVSERQPVWSAEPNLQLAFRSAAAAQRLFPHCRLKADEYVKRWSGDDFTKVGEHPREELKTILWPWLRNHEYAGPEDDDQVDEYLTRLGRRKVFLRPGLEVTRYWPWAEAVELDERGALTGEVRSAVADFLTALGEPLPPGCAVTP